MAPVSAMAPSPDAIFPNSAEMFDVTESPARNGRRPILPDPALGACSRVGQENRVRPTRISTGSGSSMS
jgi:hypothetical protein